MSNPEMVEYWREEAGKARVRAEKYRVIGNQMRWMIVEILECGMDDTLKDWSNRLIAKWDSVR